MKKTILAIVLAVIGSGSMWGQKALNEPVSGSKALKIGIGMTGVMYRGDLSDDETLFHRVYPGANISLQSDGYKSLQMQINAGFGKFADQYDEGPPKRPSGVFPIDFVETSFFYGDLRVKYRLMKRHRFQPYGSIGAGFLIFSPKDKNGKFLSDAILTRPEGEEYNTSIPQIPVSLGFQAKLTPLLWASLDYTFRYTPSDYLDNVGELGTRNGDDQLHGIQATLYFSLSGQSFEKTKFEEPIEDIWASAPSGPIADEMVTVWDPGDSTQMGDSMVAETDEEPTSALTRKERKAEKRNKKNQEVAGNTGNGIPSVEKAFEVKPALATLTPPSQKPVASKSARRPNPANVEAEILPVDFDQLIENVEATPVQKEAPAVVTTGTTPPITQKEENLDNLEYWENLSWYALMLDDVFYYRVKPEDRYESLYKRFRVSPSVLKQINELENEQPPVDKLLTFPDLRKWYDATSEAPNIIEPGDISVPPAYKKNLPPSIKKDSEGMVQSKAGNETVNWVEKEEAALAAGNYVYYLVQSDDDLQRISARFKTRKETIKTLNFMKDERVYADTFLRLPNMDIPVDTSP